MKRERQEKVSLWITVGVTVLIALLLLWLTIFEYWNS